jgi:hypothetical protein
VILGDSGEGVRSFRGYLTFGGFCGAGTIVILVDCRDNASESGESDSRDDVSESDEGDSGIIVGGPLSFGSRGGGGSSFSTRA